MEKVILDNSYEYSPEREQSLDFLFVYNVKSDFEKSNQKEINVLSHWHKEFEIDLPSSPGTYIYDGKPIRFDKDDILIVGCEHLHSFQTDKFNSFFGVLINPKHIPKKYFTSDGLLENIVTRKIPILIKKDSPIYAPVRSLAELIIKGNNDNTVSKDTIALMCITLLNILYESGEDEEDKDKNSERIKSVINYISQNYNKKITIEDLCKVSYMSESYFIRTFTKIVSMSPIQYINNYRLEKACELLENGFSVSAAAFSSGFNNVSYFIRQFKKKYNSTPSELKIKII